MGSCGCPLDENDRRPFERGPRQRGRTTTQRRGRRLRAIGTRHGKVGRARFAFFTLCYLSNFSSHLISSSNPHKARDSMRFYPEKKEKPVSDYPPETDYAHDNYPNGGYDEYSQVQCPPHTTERKLIMRIDLHVVPFLCIMYRMHPPSPAQMSLPPLTRHSIGVPRQSEYRKRRRVRSCR